MYEVVDVAFESTAKVDDLMTVAVTLAANGIRDMG